MKWQRRRSKGSCRRAAAALRCRPMPAPPPPETLATWQQDFTALRPRVLRVARFRLRRLSGEAKEEALAEVEAMAWAGYRRLREQGRDPAPFIQKIAEFAAKRYLCGHRLTGMQPARDVLSAVCRHRHGVGVQSLTESEDGAAAPEVLDALIDRKAAPAEVACFHLDLAEFLDGLDERQRSLALDLASGLNTVETARQRGVSRGTTSWLRREMRRAWESRER